MTTCWDFYPMQLLKEATWRRICMHLLSRWMYWLICESSRWPNDRVGVVVILPVFNDTVVKILAHDKGCETHPSFIKLPTTIWISSSCTSFKPSIIRLCFLLYVSKLSKSSLSLFTSAVKRIFWACSFFSSVFTVRMVSFCTASSCCTVSTCPCVLCSDCVRSCTCVVILCFTWFNCVVRWIRPAFGVAGPADL